MGQELWSGDVDVLLIEDDELVRLCLGEVLADAGWRVAVASGAEQALRMADTCTAPCVLVTDLRLGCGMDGRALITAARRRWPGLRAVLMSGGLVDMPDLAPGDRFLCKPFNADLLVQTVAELAVDCLPERAAQASLASC